MEILNKNPNIYTLNKTIRQMKTVRFLFCTLFTILLVRALPATAQTQADLAGTWKYTVSNVPVEYETGTMTFLQKDGTTTGFLGNTDKAEMKNLKLEGNTVTFEIDFQGGILKIKMELAGEKLAGMIVSQDGEFPIAATRETQN
jgi:hypothetical protein